MPGTKPTPRPSFPRSAWERVAGRSASMSGERTQSVRRVRSHAERGNEGAWHSAGILRPRAARRVRGNNGPIVGQVVLAEQHPCSSGPPHPKRPSGFEPQNQWRKGGARKVPNLRRRDYMCTCRTDQGGLAEMLRCVSACHAACCIVTVWCPPARRPRFGVHHDRGPPYRGPLSGP